MMTGLREYPVFQDRSTSITTNFVVVYSDDTSGRRTRRSELRRFLLIATVASLLLSLAVGQNASAPKPKPGTYAALLPSWNEIGHHCRGFPRGQLIFQTYSGEKKLC